ncbi:unnamed protein product [Paramecium primaurelia]|uniref:Uncharacterized protein n=1 Tax=Paramecium primaurelia TaxID=5886 RepID=A0A8S1QQQ1_PARPR|nr:unnamed protein product [Paramecium primaurelia]
MKFIETKQQDILVQKKTDIDDSISEKHDQQKQYRRQIERDHLSSEWKEAIGSIQMIKCLTSQAHLEIFQNNKPPEFISQFSLLDLYANGIIIFKEINSNVQLFTIENYYEKRWNYSKLEIQSFYNQEDEIVFSYQESTD